MMNISMTDYIKLFNCYNHIADGDVWSQPNSICFDRWLKFRSVSDLSHFSLMFYLPQ